MSWVLAIFAMNLCVREVIEAFEGDASTRAPGPLDDWEELDTSDDPALLSTAIHRSTASDDVNCTTIDDVTAARRSLCPSQCTCMPLVGQEIWTKLTVECSGTKRAILVATGWLYCVECPQYSIRLEAVGLWWHTAAT